MPCVICGGNSGGSDICSRCEERAHEECERKTERKLRHIWQGREIEQSPNYPEFEDHMGDS
jgi:hypothetical protein